MNKMEFLSKEELRRRMFTSLGGTTLDLSKERLHELPAALFELTELENLNLSQNKLTTIPESIGKLNNLTVLHVRINQLSIFPTSFTQLKKLRVLDISQNKLTTIPDGIGEMVELEGLELSGNQLTVLSPAIKQLKKLGVLSISHNNLTTIPDAIGEIVELEELRLSGNQLTVLSPAIKQLKKLKYLDVRGNPFTVEGMRSVMELKDKIHRVYSDVPEIMSEKIADGHRAQLAYERALKDGYVKVYRGRIMLIGQDRAGKTSLKKSLLGLPFDPKEQSTEGIEVDPSKCEIDVDQVRNWQSTNEKKPGLLECAKDVAEIVAEKLVVLRRNFEDISGEEDSEDGSVQEDFSEVETDSDTKGHLNNSDISSPSKKSKGTLLQDKRGERFQESKNEHLPNEPEVQIDAFSPPDDIIKHLHEWLEYFRGRVEISKEIVLSLELWDFAGQHMYYASHPIFLSSRAVYILVHNLSKPLYALAEPCIRQGTIDVKLENSNNETNIETLMSWLATVHSVAQAPLNDGIDDDSQHKLPYLCPPVFIVGTHADKPVGDIAVMKKQIQERICGKEYEKHVVRPLYCIDNTRPSSRQPENAINADNSCGDAIHSLQNRIMEVLREEPYMGEKVPIRWFLFEKVIEALVAKQIYHRNLQQLEYYARKECLMKDPDDFDSMISFYHGLGMIIKHRSTIVLKAQWLIDLVKQLITIPRYDDVAPIYSKSWRKLEREGILSTELVDHVFSRFIKESFIKEDILNMMEKFGLISKFTLNSTDVKYFVPAQLKSSPEDLLKMKPSPTDPCPLYIHFVHGFVPHGLFLQLLSRAIRWCSETWPMQGPKLYQNGAWCIIGKQAHDLILVCKMSFIKITVRQREKHFQKASVEKQLEVATLVREFVEQTLQQLPQELPYLIGMQYEMCVACPYCHPESEEDSQECAIHGKVSCTNEDCFHLLKIEQDRALICLKKVCFEEHTVLGMERWFMEGESQDSDPSSEVCTSQKSLQQKNYVKQGTPTDNELEQLASLIGEKWIKLGRRLDVEDAKLEDIGQRREGLDERAYHMLKHWKQKKGCRATFQVLNAALQDELVQRKDLAENFCYHQGHTEKRRIEDDSFPCQEEETSKRQKTD